MLQDVNAGRSLTADHPVLLYPYEYLYVTTASALRLNLRTSHRSACSEGVCRFRNHHETVLPLQLGFF